MHVSRHQEETALASKLNQLRAMTTVVADTGDLGAVARLKPVDCTTNPTIVLKAIDNPEYEDVVEEALTWGQKTERRRCRRRRRDCRPARSLRRRRDPATRARLFVH